MSTVIEDTGAMEDEVINAETATMERGKVNTHEMTKERLLEQLEMQHREFKNLRKEFEHTMKEDLSKTEEKLPKSELKLAASLYKQKLDTQEQIIVGVIRIVTQKLDKNYPVPSFIVRHSLAAMRVPAGYMHLGNGDQLQTAIKVNLHTTKKENLLAYAKENLERMKQLISDYRATMQEDTSSTENTTDFHKGIAQEMHEVALKEKQDLLESCISTVKKELQDDSLVSKEFMSHFFAVSSFPVSYTRLRNSNQLF